ncbi:MAG: hypothetical protein CMM47_06365 [Rhodospirillaceae bacterium]|nr:hypothetical protein [Rhodospirillaceae bacterium]
MTENSVGSEVEALLDRCREVHTPCGDGAMVWRTWNADRRDLRPVVLLHGGSGAWNHWVRNIPALESRYRLVAADLPGCGDSADAPWPYDAKTLAAILSCGLDLAVPASDPFDLVSFSFGGVLSGLIAHHQSQRIRSLTVVGSPILGLTGTGPANDLINVPQAMSRDEAAPLYRHNLQNLMFHNPEAADDLALWLHMTNMAKSRLRSRGIARTRVLAESLVDLPCQLNCVFGDRDVTLDPDLKGVRAYVEEVHPGVNFRIIPAAGHWVQFEASGPFNETLLHLLDP